MQKQNVLQRLVRSKTDKKIAGVCGGLGEHTDVPSWFWRLVFIASTFAWGTGVIAYILLWVFMPKALLPAGLVPKAKASASKARNQKSNWLQRFNRSAGDRKLGGVCGGLGECTPIPSWCWRVIFILMAPIHGFGFGFYILMWILVPKTKTQSRRRSVALA
jgi:phage shock protein C